MEEELKKLRDKMYEIQKAHDSKSVFYFDLETRAGKAQIEANVIVSNIGKVERDRVRILEEVVTNKATEKEVLAKSQEIAALQMGLRDKMDLIATLKKTSVEGRPHLEKLRASAMGASHSFWYRVFEIEKAKLEAEKDNPFCRAYAAMLLSGVGVDFGTFVIQHFQGKFNLDISETTKRLEREFLGKGGE